MDVHNHTARRALDWKTPLEVETGDTPDVLHLLFFDFYQPIWYWDNPNASYPNARRILGRWLGVAKNVGQALCFHILVQNGEVISRSTVKSVETLMHKDIQRELLEFNTCEVRGELKDPEFTQKFPSAAKQAKEAQRFFTR